MDRIEGLPQRRTNEDARGGVCRVGKKCVKKESVATPGAAEEGVGSATCRRVTPRTVGTINHQVAGSNMREKYETTVSLLLGPSAKHAPREESRMTGERRGTFYIPRTNRRTSVLATRRRARYCYKDTTRKSRT